MYPPVSLDHYQGTGLNGFGLGTQEQVNELQKSLTAGYVTDRSAMTGGNALRVESLEESLKVVTYTDRHLKFWPKVHKSPAFSTVEEYNQLLAYGDNNYAPWLREGELPIANDSQFQRRTQLIKFMGTVREVTHPATMIHPAHGDLIALENQNGIMWMLRMIETFLFTGNSALAFGGESEQWDGLDTLIEADMFLDLEGSPLQEADWEESSNLLAENYAYPTDAFGGFRPFSDFTKTLYPRHRLALPAPGSGSVRGGQAIEAFATQAGILNFNADIFITRPPTAPDAVRGPASLVPTSPQGFSTLASAASTLGEFDKSQGGDDAVYGYRVAAANRFGESVASQAQIVTLTSANAIAGHLINFVIQNSAAMATPPEYFNVYRTSALPAGTSLSQVQALPGTAFGLVKQVRARSQTASGLTPTAGNDTDNNRFMPFTEKVYIGEMSPQVLTFRQLAPLMRIDLAVLAPAYRWMILCYGALLLFAPRKWMRLINVGRLGA